MVWRRTLATIYSYFRFRPRHSASPGMWATLPPSGGGGGVGNFTGRFSSETFIISPGVAPTVNKFPDPPAVVPEATTGITTNPIQMYHLGIWFNSAADAAKAGCPATHTAFNGEHNAGIQVLNTATFPNTAGPLIPLP